MDRRVLLGGVAGAVAGGGVVSIFEAFDIIDIDGVFGVDLVEKIGRMLAGNPKFRDVAEAAARALAEDPVQDLAARSVYELTAQKSVDQIIGQVREDFERSRIVTVKDWVLSRTEAELLKHAYQRFG